MYINVITLNLKMESFNSLWLILIYYFLQGSYLVYKDLKNKNRKITNKEVALEVLSILVGAYFNYGSSVLNFYIWGFIATFIMYLWIKAEIIVRIGKWFRKIN
jgi:hypothetical protein